MGDWRATDRWAQEEEVIGALPKMPIPKLPQPLFRILSADELAANLTSCQLDAKNEIGIRNRALLSFMLDTGVRKVEVTNLTPADLDLKAGMAPIRGKGNKERMVFFSKGVGETEALAGYSG